MKFYLKVFVNQSENLFFVGSYRQNFASGTPNRVTIQSLWGKADYAYNNAGDNRRDHSLTGGFMLSVFLHPERWTEDQLIEVDEEDLLKERKALIDKYKEMKLTLLGTPKAVLSSMGITGAGWQAKPPSGFKSIDTMYDRIETASGYRIPASLRTKVKLKLAGAKSDIEEDFNTRAQVVRYIIDRAGWLTNEDLELSDALESDFPEEKESISYGDVKCDIYFGPGSANQGIKKLFGNKIFQSKF